MKRTKAKAWALILSVAVPGMCAFSCSGVATREVRDAAVSGVAGAVEAAVFAIFSSALPPLED